MPLTVDFVSLLLGVRQACADSGADLGIVPLAHAGTLELEPVCAVNDAVQDRVPDCVVCDNFMPSADGDLIGYQQRSFLVAIIDYFQQVTSRVRRSVAPVPSRR